MDFPEGWGVKAKNLLWEGYKYFLEQHIIAFTQKHETRFRFWCGFQSNNPTTICVILWDDLDQDHPYHGAAKEQVSILVKASSGSLMNPDQVIFITDQKNEP